MSSIDHYITSLCSEFGLESALVHAIIQAETAGDCWAFRFEPKFQWILPMDQVQKMAKACGISQDSEIMGQRTSWGVMQIMGAVAREFGFNEKFTKLCVPETGILYGCKQLNRLRAKYKDRKDLISAYNAGSVRRDEKGNYSNQGYVDKVSAYYENYKKVGL